LSPGADRESTGSSSKVVSGLRVYSCHLPSAMPLCASGEIRSCTTTSDPSYRHRSCSEEEEEQVYVHARDPYYRVDILASSRHVRVVLGGVTIAETHRPWLLIETGLPIRYYIPQQDISMDLLEPTQMTTRCPTRVKHATGPPGLVSGSSRTSYGATGTRLLTNHRPP
jgi:hypothetical protein